MGVVRNIKCKIRKMNHKCHKEGIENELIYRELYPHYLDILTNSEKELNELILNSKNLKELISHNYSMPPLSVKEKNCEMNECSQNPDNCIYIYEQLYDQRRVLTRNIEDTKRRLDRLKDIADDLSALFKGEKEFEKVVIYPRLDRHEDVVVVAFDLGGFDPSKNTPELYLSYGRVADKHSRMYLSYEGYNGALVIDDFFSMKERRNHGSIMLQILLEIIPLMNEKIRQYNIDFYNEIKNNRTYEMFRNSLSYMHPITHVKGIIYASGSYTIESLTRFYDRNGFVENGRLYRRV